MPKNSGEAVLGTGILGRRYLKQQALFSSAVCCAGTLVFYLLPSFPFDRRIGYFTLAAAVLYGAFFLGVDRLRGAYYHIITALSIFAMLGVTFIVHMTGGIASPFIFFYFAILISEAAYGVEQYISIGAAALLFSFVIIAEYIGYLPASDMAGHIYASMPTTLILSVTTVVFMGVTGFIGRIIIKQLRLAVEEESREKQAVLSKLGELEAHSQLGILAHRIVHDLRGPISSISGYLQIEMLNAKSQDTKAMLKEVNDIVVGMSESLKGITEFGKAAAPSETIVLSDFMRTLMAILSYSPQTKGVKFVKLYPENLDLCVCASRADLQQVYFNIIRNAVEAIRDNSGSKVIEISIKAVEDDVEISVSDNGPGMDPEVLKNLFRKSMTTKKDGTGVGLVITRDLLLRNGGDVEFHNLPAGGLWVATRLPAAKRDCPPPLLPRK